MLSTFNHLVWLRGVAHDAIRRRVLDDRGASLVEYALLFALILLVCIGAITVLGTATGDSVSRTADSVTVVGQGAVVRSVASPGASGAGNQVYLVTAQGIRYALESRTGDAKAALGYGAVTPAEIPVALLELIPGGPTLDIAVARTPPSQSASGAPAPAAGPSTVEPGPSASRGSPTRTGSPKPGGTTSPTGSP